MYLSLSLTCFSLSLPLSVKFRIKEDDSEIRKKYRRCYLCLILFTAIKSIVIVVIVIAFHLLNIITVRVVFTIMYACLNASTCVQVYVRMPN